MSRVKTVERIYRVHKGVCRHCGGPIPCYSELGDREVGKTHTAASIRKTREAKS